MPIEGELLNYYLGSELPKLAKDAFQNLKTHCYSDKCMKSNWIYNAILGLFE